MTDHWSKRAACRGVPIGRIYGSREEMLRFAKQFCQTCPVRKPCLQMAIDFNDQEGVWGGLRPYEKQRGASTPVMRERHNR